MKYYNEKFLRSELFYKEFYFPAYQLWEYIVWKKLGSNIKDYELTKEMVKQEYILHCKSYFKEGILFYNELLNIILNKDGTIKSLDDYIVFKLSYYGTKFLNIANECKNVFIEDRKKFKENHYDEAIITLSRFLFHDARANFKYKDNVLRIIYNSGLYEEIFEFYGVVDWEEKEFMKRNPILIIEELYEEAKGTFVYNTLWYHDDIEGKNHAELLIKFTNLVKIK